MLNSIMGFWLEHEKTCTEFSQGAVLNKHARLFGDLEALHRELGLVLDHYD